MRLSTTTSAAQKRALAKAEYNAFLAACPSRQLLDRSSDKWVVLVLCALGGDTSDKSARAMRYSEISRLLAGVSQKMLTQTLRALEHDGMITRTVTPTVPVTVSYDLTDLGLSPRDDPRSQNLGAGPHGRGSCSPRDVRRERRLINVSWAVSLRG